MSIAHGSWQTDNNTAKGDRSDLLLDCLKIRPNRKAEHVGRIILLTEAIIKLTHRGSTNDRKLNFYIIGYAVFFQGRSNCRHKKRQIKGSAGFVAVVNSDHLEELAELFPN